MSVTECAVQQINKDHVMIFFKDANGDINAFEMGEPEHVPTAREEAEKKTHGHHIPNPHSQIKHHHHNNKGGAESGYKIHSWCPISQRTPAPAHMPGKWQRITGPAAQKTSDQIAHDVKHGVTHHHDHGHDANAFVKYVMEDVFQAA